MVEIEVTLRDALPEDARGVLVPIPFDTGDQTFLGCEIDGADVAATVQAANSGQSCYWIRDLSPADFRLVYRFDRTPGTPPEWLWNLPQRPFAASTALHAQAREITATATDPVRALVDHAIDHFDYGHPERSILAGQDAVPAVCDLTEGSCVDIHTWFISGLRAVGGEATYLHGYYFRDGQSSPGFHCWLATRDGAAVAHWDLSHALIFDRRPAKPGFADYPGERFVIGAGKDIEFEVEGSRVHCHILCHPTLVGADGIGQRTRVAVRLLP